MAKPTLFQEIELNAINISQLESNKANDSDVVHVSGGTMEGNLITKGSFGLVSSLSETAINLSEASTFTKTLTTNTTFSITGVPASTSAVFTLVITNGGNYVVSWPANMKWASGEVPTLTSNGVDILTFITVDGGTTWFGTPSILDASN